MKGEFTIDVGREHLDRTKYKHLLASHHFLERVDSLAVVRFTSKWAV